MEVIQAHRARVAELQNALEESMRLEIVFHEVCAESWDLQKEYTPETISALGEVHKKMEGLAREILTVRHRLDPREPATTTEAFPISVKKQPWPERDQSPEMSPEIGIEDKTENFQTHSMA